MPRGLVGYILLKAGFLLAIAGLVAWRRPDILGWAVLGALLVIPALEWKRSGGRGGE